MLNWCLQSGSIHSLPYIHDLIYHNNPGSKYYYFVAVIMISILQMRKLRLKDVQLLAESYTFCNKSRSICLRAHALGHIFAPYENLV